MYGIFRPVSYTHLDVYKRQMYTSTPRDDLLLVLKKNLEKNNKLKKDEIKNFVKLVKMIINQNYFVYENHHYENKNGLAMGAPLSSILSEMYLQHLEENFILTTKNPFIQHIKYWYRYVDDVICLFVGTARQIGQLLAYINSINSDIKFTKEIENKGEINFLDPVSYTHLSKLFFFVREGNAN